MSRLLHDNVKIHATLARLYNVLKNWREMKTVFRRNILIRTDDLLILFIFQHVTTRSSFYVKTTEMTNVRFSVIVKKCHSSTYEEMAGKSYSLEISFTDSKNYSIMMLD